MTLGPAIGGLVGMLLFELAKRKLDGLTVGVLSQNSLLYSISFTRKSLAFVNDDDDNMRLCSTPPPLLLALLPLFMVETSVADEVTALVIRNGDA